MRMAAIYARVSSEPQREENTIASQTAALIEFAKSRDLEVPGEWVCEDEGYSGATLERPGLERVRDLAAEGQIQVMLAYSPDRLSRKYAYQILLLEEFARHGVETVFVKSPQGDSAEDQLLVQFQGMIAEYERAQILERSRRGKRHRAQSGEVSVLSNAPYGYRYIRKTDEAPAAYVVDEGEARVVRRVYEMYTVEGLSIGEITRRINAEGIPTRKAKQALGTLDGLGGAAQLRVSRCRLLRQDPYLCTDAGYAPTASAGCNYAQHHSRPRTPARRVDRDPRAGPGD
jgi:site-specific DNA recombinase